MGRKYKDVKKSKVIQILAKAKCGWCGKVIKSGVQDVNLHGAIFDVDFHFGSSYDCDTFSFEICDECFDKYLKSKASSFIDFFGNKNKVVD